MTNKKYKQIHPIDLTGCRFERLTVVAYSDKKVKNKNSHYYVCVCDCGVIKDIRRHALLRGETQSCGCLRSDLVSKANIKHGQSKDRLYATWSTMRYRCNNSNADQWRFYGGRGIKVCEEWNDKGNGYLTFKEWALANGYKPNLTIDRIDSNGNYEPSNCQWATDKEQARNRGNTVIVEVNNKTYYSLSALAEETGIPREILQYRLRNGVTNDLLIYPGKTRIPKMLAIQNGEISLDTLLKFDM